MMMRVFVVVMMFLGVGLMSVEAQTSCAGTSLFYEKKREGKTNVMEAKEKKKFERERERERERKQRERILCVCVLSTCASDSIVCSLCCVFGGHARVYRSDLREWDIERCYRRRQR